MQIFYNHKISAIALNNILINNAFFLLFLVFPSILLSQQAQSNNYSTAINLLNKRNEVEVIVNLNTYNLNWYAQRFSIGRVGADSVCLFLNQQQFANFLQLNLPYNVVLPDSIKHSTLKSASTQWDGLNYPSYMQYLSFGDSIEAKYPQLCKQYLIGNSVLNKKINCYRITANIANNIPKPKVFFTAAMHGNELVGFYVLLKLSAYLCSQYGNNAIVTELLNNSEIWINPLANPDGAYNNAEGEILIPARFNANSCDLNRNFPDQRPKFVTDPNGFCNTQQPETEVMINFMKQQGFTLSANLHGGAEVVNYPWDARWFATDNAQHPDSNWFSSIATQYVDSVKKFGPAGYFSDFYWGSTLISGGKTLGYSWYEVNGSRQDYVTYYLHGRETTIEISNSYFLVDTLNTYWQANQQALLAYAQNVLKGISGQVFDLQTQLPLTNVKVSITEFDSQNSEVYTNTNGYFYRLIEKGSYNLSFENACYQNLNVEVTIGENEKWFNTLYLNNICNNGIKSNNITCIIYPTIFAEKIYCKCNGLDNKQVEFYNNSGQLEKVIKLNNNAEINTSDFADNAYFYRIISENGVVNWGKIIKTCK